MSNSLIRRGLDLLSDDLPPVEVNDTKGGKKSQSQATSKSQRKMKQVQTRNSLKNKKLKSTPAIYAAHRKTDKTEENLTVINYLKLIDSKSRNLINRETERHTKKLGIEPEKRRRRSRKTERVKAANSKSSSFTDADFDKFFNEFDFDSLRNAPDADMLDEDIKGDIDC